MALIQAKFKCGDAVIHKKLKKTYEVGRRYKNTIWLECVKTKITRVVKIKTLNYCYELDKTWMVLYGNVPKS